MKRKIYITILVLLSATLGAWTVKYFFQRNKSSKENNQINLSDYLQPDYSKIKPFNPNDLKPPKLSEAEYKRLITCEVCGYKAVCPDSTYCYNCRSEIFDTTFYSKSEKLEWLKNEQLIWFTPMTPEEKISLYGPKIEDGFIKDSLWKPAITEKDVADNIKYK
jgi:hypothetical protein